jgi:hypothetical protein
VHQLPEARELRRELTGGDGGVAVRHAGVEASAGHGEGQEGAHELQQVEVAVVRKRRRRMRGWKRVAGGSRNGELIGGEEDGRFSLLPCRFKPQMAQRGRVDDEEGEWGRD